MKLFPGQMRQMKIKEIWDFKNSHLVDRYGQMTSYGKELYWLAVDAATKFNITKHEQVSRNYKAPNAKNNQGTRKRGGEDDKMQEFFHKHRTFNDNSQQGDIYHWHRNKSGRKLPTPNKYVK